MAKQPNQALYIEMTKDTRGAQLILTPPFHNIATDETVKAKMFARKISAVHPRRAWNTFNNRAEFDTNPVNGGYLGAEAVLYSSAPVVKGFNDLLVGYVASGWKITGAPIAVEMTYDDERDVEEGKSPSALVRRITRSRIEAGYPATIWPGREVPTPRVEPAINMERSIDEILREISSYRPEPKVEVAPSGTGHTAVRWGTPDKD